MKKLLLIAICLMGVFPNIQAQSLTGKVIDKTNQPIAYASVALMSSDDKTLLAGTISDAEGLFTLEKQKSGKYLLSISFVGYKTLKQPIDLIKSYQGSFVLEDDAVALGEVVIEANRSNTVKQSAVGQTFMLSAASMKKKDVMQALQEIPTLTIDPDTRKILMNNGNQPLVLVNGVRREGGLSAISPEDIISVDVVQTASAEFMREGYTSVVNIKVKKTNQKYTAFNGGINTHPSIRFGVADASLEVGGSRSSLYLTAQSFAFLNNKSDMFERTLTGKTLRELNYKRNSDYNDTYVALGGDRLWSDVDYSSFSVTFDYIPQHSEANGEDLLTDRITNEIISYDHWRELNDKSYVGSVNLYHKHEFVNSSVLDFLFQLNLSKNINRVNQLENNESMSNTYHYDFRNSHMGLSFTPSYKFKVAGFSSKLGLNTNFQSNSIKQKDEVSSGFKHQEWNEYIYLDVNRMWGAFSLAASLGMDVVYREVEGYSDHYYNLRPVVNLGYRFNKHHSLLLNYSMQSVAPNVVQLNPYNTSSDTLTVSTGNPFLKPYRIQAYRLAYTLTAGGFYVEPSIAYRCIDDAIVSSGEDKGGYYVKSLANQGKSTLIIAGFNLRYTIKNLGFVGATLNYNHKEFTKIGQKDDYLTGRFYAGMSYKKIGLNFSYGLPDNNYDMYTRAYSSPESNMTLSYSISKNWDVSAGMCFIGWKKHIERWVDMPDYSNYYNNQFTNRGNIVMIGARYKFQGHSKLKREQKKLENTDKGFRVISE